MNNIASYTGAMQEEAALEEDAGEKLNAVGPGWLVNGCPRKLRFENNLPENKRSTHFFPFFFHK